MIFLILRIVLMLALTGLWTLWVFQCRSAVENLRALIGQMRNSRLMNYPEVELHPLLCPGKEQDVERHWLRIDENGKQDTGPLSRIPDVEEERAYPYYNRTGQIICNSRTRTLEEISSGRWYGYPEWLQDIISGKADPADFEGVSESKEKG